MKFKILTIAALLGLSACNNKSEELPTSLEGRMKVMSALKEEMAGLEALIQEVQDSINVLSPKTINKRPVTVITPKKSDFKHYYSIFFFYLFFF